jgi:Fungal cellulose binding domain.
MKVLIIAAVLSVFSVFTSSAQFAQPYSQCGGIGWTGPTVCVPGWACIVINPFYHQCLPLSGGVE